jgi:putative ABC transport system substrate-binding protein
MRRRDFITLLGGAATAWPLSARAQQSAKILHVGFLYPGPLVGAAPRIAPFTSGLLAGGLRVPDQVMVIPSVTDGNAALLAPMATELVARKVDAILVVGPAAVRAARAATTTIPIVAIDLESDPTDSGFIASYTRPGGNITGVFLDFPEFSKKWLEALKEAVPKISSVAVFWDSSTGPTQARAIEAAAQILNIKLVILEMPGRADVESAFKSVTGQGASALLILSSPFVSANTKLPADQALASPPGNNPVSTLCARRRIDGLWAQSSQLFPPRRCHDCQNSARSRPCRNADRPPHKVRVRFESQDGSDAWHCHSTGNPTARRRGDRVTNRRAFISLLSGAGAWPLTVRAQQAPAANRIL